MYVPLGIFLGLRLFHFFMVHIRTKVQWPICISRTQDKKQNKKKRAPLIRTPRKKGGGHTESIGWEEWIHSLFSYVFCVWAWAFFNLVCFVKEMHRPTDQPGLCREPSLVMFLCFPPILCPPPHFCANVCGWYRLFFVASLCSPREPLLKKKG
ncbi:MAG: hypothetical protein J3R72DRAFT_169148 [Linnemannia gamsii]|nr:MAG: hypothetical protein J3R72DRAFT_169148 [Linnemannia gamsii]